MTPERRTLRALMPLLLGLLLASPAAAVTINKVVATVDGDPITLYEIKTFVRDRSRGEISPGYEFDPSPYLDAYVTEKIIEKEITESGILVREAEIDRYIDTIKARNRLSDEQLREAVEGQGLTWEGYRKQVRQEIEKAQLINREIRGKVNVTPEDVERYYEAHLSEYELPGQLHLRHIVLLLPAGAPAETEEQALAQAEDLHRRIEAGEDFEALAREYSQDAAAKDGGDLGWVSRGQIFDAIEDAANLLDAGEVSEPVRTEIGIHLVMLEEKRGESHKPLDELADDIREQLYAAALEERYDRWLKEDLRKRHHVEIRP